VTTATALVAAASVRHESGVGLRIGGYREFDSLNEPQRAVVLGYVEQIVEAYLGALAELEHSDGAAA
jgi:hypothetical protein